VLFPAVIFALLLCFQNFFGYIDTKSLVLGFFFAISMPTAGLATTFADEFKGDTKNAVIYTLGTTTLSILTIPLIYWVLNFFI
jgi:predicted permease